MLKATWISAALPTVIVLEGLTLAFTSVPVQQEPAPAAKGVVVPGGVSPDKRLEIRIVEAEDFRPSNYVIAVVDVVTRRVVKELSPSGGYYSYALVREHAEGRGYGVPLVRALWHEGGRFVAVTDFGLKTANTLYLYEVTGTDVVAVRLPDFEQNALGRVDPTAWDRTAITELRKWDGNVLHALFTFRVLRPGPTHETETFSVPFSVRLRHGPGTGSSVILESMGKPTRLPCC